MQKKVEALADRVRDLIQEVRQGTEVLRKRQERGPDVFALRFDIVLSDFSKLLRADGFVQVTPYHLDPRSKPGSTAARRIQGLLRKALLGVFGELRVDPGVDPEPVTKPTAKTGRWKASEGRKIVTDEHGQSFYVDALPRDEKGRHKKGTWCSQFKCQHTAKDPLATADEARRALVAYTRGGGKNG